MEKIEKDKKSSGIVDADVKCPFYRRHKRFSILCEGIYKGTTLTIIFETDDDRRIQMEERCRDRYRECRIYRTVSALVYGGR